MQVEWEPDADNVYLTSEGQDNLALHRASQPNPPSTSQNLDHIGFALPSLDDVDAWYAWIKQEGVPVLRDIQTHLF